MDGNRGLIFLNTNANFIQNKMKNLVNKLEVLKQAFIDVNLAWEECKDIEIESYPFESCFNELTTDVIIWADDFTERLQEEIKLDEEEVPITYAYIKRTVGWSKFCDVTGKNHYTINEHGEYQDTEIFRITVRQAEQLNFI